ncbi:protein MKS1-like [Typha latifolia]|uniref:protein MKS1-like n=1 Tax=Typha latifolia TaxID=4733 RepID=UPI003C2CCE89
MASEHNRGRPSVRREIQGPRPTPLRVSKDSHKIKKPPLAPLPLEQAAPPLQNRQPIIIYEVSPRVIHTNPNDFMSLVQRLTGASSSSSGALPDISHAPPPWIKNRGGAVSPAARLAVMEQGNSSSRVDMPRKTDADAFDQLGLFPSILSPLPSTLPPISPNFFSPLMSVNPLSFLQELSPAFTASMNFAQNTLASPSFLLSTSMIPSPTAYWELFHQYQNL